MSAETNLDRPVAVKVLSPELAAVLGAERFIQEIKTTANLQHPHILPLFDSGEADGFLYFVTVRRSLGTFLGTYTRSQTQPDGVRRGMISDFRL